MRNYVKQEVETLFGVDSGCSANIAMGIAKLPKPFMIDKITIPDASARDFLVSDIKVGKNSQLYSVGAIPALVYAKSSKVRQPDLDVVGEGEELVLSVTCQSPGPSVFAAIVEGHRVERDEVRTSTRRRLVLGYGSTSVAPMSRANISVQAQCPFRPDGLVVSSDIASSFHIEDFKVGRNCQVDLFDFDGREGVQRGVTADLFSELQERKPVRMDPVSTMVFMTVVVENVTNTVRNFQGAIVGEGHVNSDSNCEVALDFLSSMWTPGERSLVATRLLAIIQEDLSLDKYGMVNRPTLADVVQVLNAPSYVLEDRRSYYARVMTGETPAPASVESILE